MTGVVSGISLMAVVIAVSLLPASFADHIDVTVDIPEGASFVGCEMADECFVPSSVTVDAGGRVTWTNSDTVSHTVTSGSIEEWQNGLFDSGLLQAGRSFSVTFDGYEPGAYPYLCLLHPWHVGTVTVSGSDTASGAPAEGAPAQGGPTRLSLEPIPSRVMVGDTVTFKGILETVDGHPVPSAKIRIKDDIFGLPDIVRLTAVTDVNGEFSATWVAKTRSSGGAYDFYAVFEGSDRFDRDETKNYSVRVSPYHPTEIILDDIPSSAYTDETVRFTGRLTTDGRGVPNAAVEIREDDPGIDQLLARGHTDSNGRFSIPWDVEEGLIETDFDVYASFDNDDTYGYARSYNQEIRISKHGGSISLDPIPSSARVGERVDFSGTLRLNGASPEGAVVYIKDEDSLSRDELLVTAYVGKDGRFSTYWFAYYADVDDTVDVFAVFEGNEDFARLTTCGTGCKSTEPLLISGTLPPPSPPPTLPPPPPPTLPPTSPPSTLPPQPLPPTLPPSFPPDGWIPEDGYMELYYVMDLPSSPKVAIVPDPGSYDEVRSHIVPVQEGIMMWTSGLEGRYGGSWDIDFEIIAPGQIRFDNDPDVIVNLITPERDARCDDDAFGWARVSSHVPPVPTHVCSSVQGQKRSNDDVMATAAHEFIHALGLGHTFGKDGDRMCSTKDGVPTCPSLVPKEKKPSILNLDAVAAIYGTDGFENPNNRFERFYKFYAVEIDSGSAEASPGIQDGPVGGTGPEQTTRPSAYIFMAGGDEFTIPYSAGSNSIVAMAVNLESRSLVIETDVAGDGEIVIALPRHLIDAKNADGTDAAYIVLVDGVESWVTETADGAARTLTIPVSAGAREIEIFGTQAIPEFGAPGIQDGPVGGTGPEQTTRPSAYIFMAGGDEFTIPYSAGSNSIVAMAVNLESRSLVIETDVAGDGEIVIALPRHLIDAKNADGTDAAYIVLVDGVESWVTETADGAARTLTIPVSAGAREIEIFGTQAIPEFGAPGIQDGPATPTPATDPIPETGATSFQTFRTPEFSIRHPSDWDVDDEVIDLGTNPGMWESATSFVAFYDDADDTVLEVVFYEEDDNAINNRGEAYLDRLEDSLRQACRQASYEYEGFECSNYSLADSQVREGAGGAVYQVTETWTETYGPGDSADYVGLHSSIPVGRNAWMVYSFTASDVFSQHSSVISGMLASFKPTGAVDDGMMDDVVEDKPETPSGGGCLIATAAYGSELAPQVQFLREIRDSTLLPTASGSSFMAGFNQFYYSFSPAVADLERKNVVFRDAVRVTIAPALYTLNIMTLADQNSDASVIAFGLLAIAAMAGIYVAGPVLTIRAISRRAR